MKKLILLLSIVTITSFVYSQEKPGAFKGFFKPVDAVINKQNIFMYSFDENVSESVWLFRPSVTLTAVAIDLSSKPAVSKSLSSAGFGISYGKFTTINNEAWCNYSVNALMLTGLKLGDVQQTDFGAALTIDIFNKLIGCGVGYIDKKVILLTTISYSF